MLFFSCSTPDTKIGEKANSEFYRPWGALGELFHDVQMSGVYPDSKTFVDCIPKKDLQEIADDYRKKKDLLHFDLASFVKENFSEPPAPPVTEYEVRTPFEDHLTNQWDFLTRAATSNIKFSTLISLPNQYVVPGGRFREVYYWDSYFTMIGLGVSGREDLIKTMIDNFAFLIDSIGFIPNGNRTYYLGRSQPSYFSSMVNLYMQLTGRDEGLNYLDAIQKEYNFWMEGVDDLTPDSPTHRRVVLINDGVILNRYWDDLDFPRPESHKEDFELANDFQTDDKKELYRNLRAGAESGWDYSTRWFRDKKEFKSIQTIDIIPVDLNCLLYKTETVLEKLYTLKNDTVNATFYKRRSYSRKQAIQQYFWNEEASSFTDFLWKENKPASQVTLAAAYPLYFKVATEQQADQQAAVIRKDLLLPGGVVTTKIESGQQWDYPNGWAPLQWITIKGLEQYGKKELAGEITQRWLRVNQKVYENTGKMMEKYNVADTSLVAGGGEYPTQDGFGWTNGVALGLMAENPEY